MALQNPLVFNPIGTTSSSLVGLCVCVYLYAVFVPDLPLPDISAGNKVTGVLKLSSMSHGYVVSSLCIHDFWSNMTLPAGSHKPEDKPRLIQGFCF